MKPERYAFWFPALASRDGYVYHFQFKHKSNVTRIEDCPDSEQWPLQAVNFCKFIMIPPSKYHLPYVLFPDRAYTSVSLGVELWEKYRVKCIGTMREDRLMVPSGLKDQKLAKRTNAAVYWPDKFAIHKIVDNGTF